MRISVVKHDAFRGAFDCYIVELLFLQIFSNSVTDHQISINVAAFLEFVYCEYVCDS